uniref:hypothetical protein n=1 Tax=Saccharopolyspora galaxeae TaxID=2781241 RepID=UPI001F27852D|nr:hypothetical protein [Saccharopolyspora sp. HNM0986]
MATRTEGTTKTNETGNGQPLGEAVDQARTPLLAALGAGDLAAHTIADALGKLRSKLNEGAESARSGVNELPQDLRERFDPAELRKLVDEYTQSAVQLYGYLAERGETAFERFQSQPGVQRAWGQVEQAQGRMEAAVTDARGLADDVLGKVSTASRSFGEKAARSTEQASASAAQTVRETSDDVAESVEETGSETATATRSTAQKTANRTSAAKSTGSAKGTGSKQSKGKAGS